VAGLDPLVEMEWAGGMERDDDTRCIDIYIYLRMKRHRNHYEVCMV